jgi:3-oxoacyl-[acyl-carrier-protein] synthase I
MHNITLAATAAITSVGLTAAQTAASVRAGICRNRTFAYQTSCSSSSSGLFEASVPDDCLPVMDRQMPPVQKRLLQLTGATAGQLAHIKLDDIPLVVGLAPGAFAGHSDPDILHMMAEQLGATIVFDGSRVIKQGRAAGLMAIEHACRLINDNKADTVLAGGCDTFHDPDLLGRLNIANRIKSRTAMDFFVPGEGAGFVLLKRSDPESLAQIWAGATGFEPGHPGSAQPYRATALADTIGIVCRPLTDKIATLFAGMNGESHWAKEWANALFRCSEHFDPAMALHHPAEYYGDAGAAAGPIMTALAAIGMRRGYLRGPALVYASSDQGPNCVIGVNP